MLEWMVRLAGPERDLRFLLDRLQDRDWRVTEDGGEFRLRSRLFQGLADAGEVKRVADEMIELANLAALLRFERYRGVQTAGVVRVDPDGSQFVTIGASDEVRIGVSEQVTISASGAAVLGSATAIGFATVVGSPPAPPLDLARDRAAFERRPSLKKAVGYLRDEPGWFGYWKAAEALGQEIGAGGLDRIPELGWASEDQFKRFKKTVQYHRHHTVPAPPNPMSESETRAFINGLLRRCLEWNLSGRPKPA